MASVGVALGALGADLELRDKFTEVFDLFEHHIDSAVSAVTVGFGVITAVVGGLTATIVELGSRGAEINDVAENFDKLNESIGNNAETLGTIRKALDGTVSDFEIMKMTNKALGQGLELTSAQLETTGEAARVLAKRIGGDATSAYNSLLEAMATGRTRGLREVGLRVDAAEATLKYANALRVGTSELTAHQKQQAIANAVLEQAKTALDASGKATVDFHDRIEQAKTAADNFWNALSSAVAKSPVVNKAFELITKSIQSAFGDDQTQKVANLMTYVNKFVILLSKAAEIGIEVARALVFGWDLIKIAVLGVMLAVQKFIELWSKFVIEVATGLLKIADGFLLVDKHNPFADPEKLAAAQKFRDELARQIAVGNTVVKTNVDMTQSYKDQIGAVLDGAAKQNAAFDKAKAGVVAFTTELQKVNTTHVETSRVVTETTKKITEETEASKEAAKALNAYYTAVDKLKLELGQAFSSGMSGQDMTKEFGAALESISLQAERLGQTLPKVLQEALATTRQFKVTELMKTELPKQEKLVAEYQEKLNQLTLTGEEKRVDAIRSEQAKALAALNETKRALEERMKTEHLTAPPEFENSFKAAGDAIIAYFHRLEFGSTLKENLAAALHDLPQTILTAIQSGGGASGIGQAVGNLFGSKIFSADSSLVKGMTTGLTKLLGKGLGDALGTVIPGLGGIIGSGIGKLFGSIFGPSQAKQTQQLRDAFLQTVGGLDAFKLKAEAAGVSLDKLLSTKKVKDFNSELANVQKELQDHDTAMSKLDGAMQKWGITIGDLGPKFRAQKLGEQALGLYEDFQLLTAAGVSTETAIKKMGPALLDVAKTAMTTGTALPLAMKPMIDALAASGQLVDANGKSFKTAQDAGITFAQTMDEQFKTLIQSIQDLVDALNGVKPKPINIPVNYSNTGGYGPGTSYGPPSGGYPTGPPSATGALQTQSAPSTQQSPNYQRLGDAGPSVTNHYNVVVNVTDKMSPDDAAHAVATALDRSTAGGQNLQTVMKEKGFGS